MLALLAPAVKPEGLFAPTSLGEPLLAPSGQICRRRI